MMLASRVPVAAVAASTANAGRFNRAPAANGLKCIPNRRSRRPPTVVRRAESPSSPDAVADNVERAAQLLDQIIKETVEAIFVEEAVEEVIPGDDDDDVKIANGASKDLNEDAQIGKPPVVDKEAVLRGVILKHLDEFDGSFLAAISAYVQVAEASGDFGLLSMLAAIRDEVIAAVSGEMQPEIQVVQLVARLADKEDRLEVLRAAHRGGGKAAGENVPGAKIENVENAAARLCDEMESSEHVPNWQLLYQLLLTRETSRQLHPNVDALGVYNTTVVNSSFSPSEIPVAEAAMIKELVMIAEPLERRANVMAKFVECQALDESATRSNLDSGKIKLKRTSRGFKPRDEEVGDEDRGMDVFDIRDVRPGRFIDCVLNMRVAMQREGPDASVMVEVLTAMYFEACDVVLEQAEKGAKKYRASEQSLEEFGDSAKS